MTPLNFVLVALAIGSFAIGGVCLFLVRCHCKVLSCLGRRLFFAAMLVLGGAGLLAAVACVDGLAPLGLLAGLLVVAMLWEMPAIEMEQTS